MEKLTEILTTKKLLLCLALSVGGYAFGRFSSPAKIEIKSVEVERFVEKKVEVVKYIRVKAKETKKNIVTEKTTETRPDGSSKIVEVTKDTTAETVKDTSKLAADSASSTDSEKRVEKSETRDNRDNTRIGALVSFNPNRLTFVGPIDHGFISFGGLIEKRIFGPIWFGGYITSALDIGLTTSLTF